MLGGCLHVANLPNVSPCISLAHQTHYLRALTRIPLPALLSLPGRSWLRHCPGARHLVGQTGLFPCRGAQGTTTAVRVGLSAVLMLLWRPWRWRLSRADAQAVMLYGAALGAMTSCSICRSRPCLLAWRWPSSLPGRWPVAIWSSRRAVDFCGWLSPSWAWACCCRWAQRQHAGPVGRAVCRGAAVFWALYIVFGKRARAPACRAVGVAGPAGGGAGGGAGGRGPCAGAALLSPSVLLVGGGCGGHLQRAAHLAGDDGLKRLPKEAFGIMISMEPAVAALLALAFAGRAAGHRAVARHWLHRGRIHGQRRLVARRLPCGAGAACLMEWCLLHISLMALIHPALEADLACVG